MWNIQDAKAKAKAEKAAKAKKKEQERLAQAKAKEDGGGADSKKAKLKKEAEAKKVKFCVAECPQITSFTAPSPSQVSRKCRALDTIISGAYSIMHLLIL